MMIDFADEYGVLSLNALSNATDEGASADVLQGNNSCDWFSSSSAILPNVSVVPLAQKSSDKVSAKRSIHDILEKLSSHSKR